MTQDQEQDCPTPGKPKDVLTAILDELDANLPADRSGSRRTDERFRYRKNRLIAWIQQPGDAAPKKHSVLPRNLSESGMAFLHGGFVHTGSKVTVQLITLHGTWHDAEGLVATCRLVRGSLHEVGVKFLTNIQPSAYCTDAVHPRVLLVDDDPSIVRLAQVLLKKLNAEVTCVDNGQAAIETAFSATFDLIMMDVEMPTMDGLSATRELRSKGYSGKIVAATARTQPEDRQICLEAGCDDYLPKPYNKDALARLLESVNQEPVFSTLSDDPTMTDVINEFITEIPLRIRELEEAVKGDDAKTAALIARRLKGEGSMYGFDILTDAAMALETILIGGSSVTEARTQMNDLVQLCMQVRSTSVANTTPVPAGEEA